MRSVALGGIDAPDLHVLEGCKELRRAKIQGKRHAGAITFGWADPPDRLEYLQLIGLPIASLDGIEQLPRLQNLIDDLTHVPQNPPKIDLSPLRGCRQFRSVQIGKAGHPTNVQVLRELPHLQIAIVLEGMHSPTTNDVSALRII